MYLQFKRLQLCSLLHRSLYSSLVEEFGSTQRTFSNDLNNSFRKSNDSRASPSQQQEQPGADSNKIQGTKSQDPVASAYGDGGHAEKLAGQ